MEVREIGNETLRSLTGWLAEVGVSSITGWRWRKRGWLKTVNIGGRHYVSKEAVLEFKRRAELGEFASLTPNSCEPIKEEAT